MEERRREIEPWLSALFQSEHLSVLLGSGFTSAVAREVNAGSAGMQQVSFGCQGEDRLNEYARKKAAALGRGAPNFEDQISAALTLKEGLAIAGRGTEAAEWEAAIDRVLTAFMGSILTTECDIQRGLEASTGGSSGAPEAVQTLVSFLVSFASRAASRERLHLFTTNYDRLIEYGCELAGLRLIDRFVGSLSPVFRSSRLQVDMHYNPPGIRGEPRLLEGVVHFTKLHGSLDWRRDGQVLRRVPMSFGAPPEHPEMPSSPARSVMIYPNSAKDIETAAYPYADLFRDFSCAVCRPNSVLVTYGYGFGDDHVNRVLADMLTIPSTHLVIASFGDGGADPHARVRRFCETQGRMPQTSLLLGSHFAHLRHLTRCYLPKPAIDLHTLRMAQLLDRRARSSSAPEPPLSLPDGAAKHDRQSSGLDLL
jgi:hypothetical protein